jgi:hypothetical protein
MGQQLTAKGFLKCSYVTLLAKSTSISSNLRALPTNILKSLTLLIIKITHEERKYRSLINKDNLVSYNVTINESDLFIRSDTNLPDVAIKSLIKHRNSLENYINNHPEFRTSLLPFPKDNFAPPIIQDMINKSAICGVGPMAGVVGAVSEYVRRDLLGLTDNLIIENGGDICFKSERDITVSIYSATLADVAESAVGNQVKSKKGIKPTLDYGIRIPGIHGIVSSAEKI